jgi:excinuclease UvrABC helicase subunit UvrB
MTEPVAEENVQEKSVGELVEELEESIRQAARGETYSSNEAIRERVAELREQS